MRSRQFKRSRTGAYVPVSTRPTFGRMSRKKIMGETGYVDLASASYNCDSTGSIALINTVGQGSSTNQRVGKRIMLKSLQGRGRVSNNSTAAYNDVAILIVYDKRPTGTLPNITDILDTVSPSSFNNDDNSGRFQILKRWDLSLIGSAANNYTPISQYDISFFLDLKGKPQEFGSAGTGAIGDIEVGALYIVTLGATAAGTTAATYTSGFRTRFIDV
jgi:hypothetical protein